MYDLPYFKANSQADVLGFMKAHPFITLCGVDEANKPVATQVPVLLTERDGRLILRGHIQRKTDHHQAFENNRNVLAIFTGPSSYVSASWYVNQKLASTWNYQSVHATGTIGFVGDEALHQLLTELTAFFENDPGSPSQVKDLSPAYVEKLMRAIIAFEITVTNIGHVFKLSQNRDADSRERIIERLANASDHQSRQVAEEMQKYYSGTPGQVQP